MTMTIGWPQALFLFFMLIPVITSVAKHGEEKSPEFRKFNAPAAILRFLGGVAILAWGGFFQ